MRKERYKKRLEAWLGFRDSGGSIRECFEQTEDMEAACREALQQIEKKDYKSRLIEDGMETIFQYGIACRRKKCQVKVLK